MVLCDLLCENILLSIHSKHVLCLLLYKVTRQLVTRSNAGFTRSRHVFILQLCAEMFIKSKIFSENEQNYVQNLFDKSVL